MNQLELDEDRFNWLISKYKKINEDKELLKALKKIVRQY